MNFIYALANGVDMVAIAADDFHMKEHVQSITPTVDIEDRHIGGYIMVESEDRRPENLIRAIKDGKFYSTMGPEFYNIDYDNGKLCIECSPVSKIKYYANKDMLKVEKGEGIISSHITKSTIDYFKIRAKRDNVYGCTQNYLFIKIEDENGKKAWTNNLIWYIK